MFLDLLRTDAVRVFVDPQVSGVKLPARLMTEKTVTLVYGYNLPVPITDMEVDETGIKATLSFSREPFSTFVPWRAVLGMCDPNGYGVAWDKDFADLNMATEREGAGGMVN